MADLNQMVAEFERGRQQLMGVTAQKQRLEMQSQAVDLALKELKDSKEKKVYKAAGPILLLSDAGKVKKDLENQKESIDLRVKSFQKQEDGLMDKLKKLKTDIEKSQGGSAVRAAADAGDATVKTKPKAKGKPSRED